MIRLTEDYVIDANNYGYRLEKDLHTEDKDGQEKYSVVGYYSSLKGAIKGALKCTNLKDIAADGEMTLSEAMKKIEENQRKFEELLGAIREDID